MVDKLFRVAFSGIAKQRLREISDYTARAAYPAVSRKVRRGILKEAGKLEKFPASNPPLPGTEDYDYEVRYTKAWSYKIIFRVFNPENVVRVMTIRHDAELDEDVRKDLD